MTPLNCPVLVLVISSPERHPPRRNPAHIGPWFEIFSNSARRVKYFETQFREGLAIWNSSRVFARRNYVALLLESWGVHCCRLSAGQSIIHLSWLATSPVCSCNNPSSALRIWLGSKAALLNCLNSRKARNGSVLYESQTYQSLASWRFDDTKRQKGKRYRELETGGVIYLKIHR